MGQPKKNRKKYTTPSHPWQKERILEEIEISKEYGLKNKREIWKMKSMLAKFSREAKNLITLPPVQAELEKKHLLDKLRSINLIKDNAGIDDILGLTLKNIMERRLQTLVLRKNLAKTISQSRQFIVHGHISINNKVITSPQYVVTSSEEALIMFAPTSALSSIEHPEREIKPAAKETVAAETKEKPKKPKIKGKDAKNKRNKNAGRNKK